MSPHVRRRRRVRRGDPRWPARSGSDPATPASTLRWLSLGAAALFAAFATYGSWVPLEIHIVPLDVAIARFSQTPLIPLHRASRTDFVTNVLLFMPIGFFLVGALAGRTRAAAVAWLAPVTALCLGLSVAIEFGQIFVSGRTPSWNDVVAETLGAALGAGAWLLAGPDVLDWIARLARADSSRTDTLWRLLGIYTAAWVLLGVLPLDFTIRPQELAQKLRAGRIVLEPFGGPATLSDNIGVVLMALPIGGFGLLLGMRRRSEWPLAFALLFGGALTSSVEFAQLLAFSRTADVTDLFMNMSGVALGAWALGRGLERDMLSPDTSVRLWPLGALALWCVVLGVRHWSPFDFALSADMVKARLPIMFQVPFRSYYWGMPLNSLAEAMTKVLLSIPVGILLQLTWSPRHRLGRILHTAVIVAAAAVIFLAIEFGQLLVPSRVPDQTDVYIGIGAAMAGMAISRLLTRRRAGGAGGGGHSL